MEDQTIAVKGDKFRNEHGKQWTVEEVRLRRPGDKVAWGTEREVVVMSGPGDSGLPLIVAADGLKRSEHGGLIPSWAADVPPPDPSEEAPPQAPPGEAMVCVLNLHEMAQCLWDEVRKHIGIEALREMQFDNLPGPTQAAVAAGANAVAKHVISHIAGAHFIDLDKAPKDDPAGG